MKAQTINFIRNLIAEEQEKAGDAYGLFREKMIDKYQTDWFRDKMNETEQEILSSLRKRSCDLRKVLEDFENHQW